MSEYLGPIYRELQALYLAKVLLDLNADHTAQRVLDELRDLAHHLQPVILQRIEEHEAQVIPSRMKGDVDQEVPLSDAILNALREATR